MAPLWPNPSNTCVHPAAAGLFPLLPSSGSKEGSQPWPSAVGKVPNTRPPGRVWVLAKGSPWLLLGFCSPSHYGPVATTVFGEYLQ